jgi:hypothetical protein
VWFGGRRRRSSAAQRAQRAQHIARRHGRSLPHPN